MPIARPPVPAGLWRLPKFDYSTVLVICDSQGEETPIVGVAWRYPERSRMIEHRYQIAFA
jgi:hypothetical protein